ncbi:MAG: PAS domain-containing protein [Spirochaetes bacterium]|jgi:two-component system phosphate regulon sensor histidine kinase PhoR|nr:PAS domain-containing protein [Spirochaetota bacterium]
MSPRKAALRTFLRNFLGLTGITLALGLTSVLLARDAVIDRHIEATAAAVETAAVVAGIPADPSPGAIERFGDELLTGLEVELVTVFAADGTVLAELGHIGGSASRYARPPEYLQAARSATGSDIRRDEPEGPIFVHVARALQLEDGAPAYVVRVSQPRTTVLSGISGMMVTLGYVLVALISAAALYLWRAARGYETSLASVMEAANLYSRGELTHRAQVDLPAPAFNDIARRLNVMASGLSRRFAAVRADRDEFETILSNMVEGVILLDERAHIRFLNNAAREIFAAADSDARGKSLVEFTRNAEIDEFARAALQTDHALERTVAIYEQEIVYLQLHGSALLGASGTPAGAVVVISDVSRLKRLENVRRDFVANVSHELKTPITSVMGFVETMRDGAVDDPTQARRFLDIIADHAQRLNLIIDDLLSLSRLETRQEEVDRQEINTGDLVHAVMEACRPQAERKGVRLYRDCECSSDAYVNASLLQQAVTNLVDNAVKYSPRGAHVGIEITRSEGELLIAVADTGPGIPRRDVPRIFERFYRVDQARSRALGGTGLGLSIVKHIAQAHGGSVEVESELGRGSRFTIRLPQHRS